MTANPPGTAGYSGPLTSTRRALTVARLGCARLGVTRLAFCPQDTTDAAGTGPGPLYLHFRDDSEPGVYAPPRDETAFTEVLR